MDFKELTVEDMRFKKHSGCPPKGKTTTTLAKDYGRRNKSREMRKEVRKGYP